MSRSKGKDLSLDRKAIDKRHQREMRGNADMAKVPPNLMASLGKALGLLGKNAEKN